MDRQMETIRGGGYEADIAPWHGGTVMQIRFLPDGMALLHVPSSEQEWELSPFIYGMPVLFPPNRIDGGTFESDGRTYRFPVTDRERGCSLHGKLHTEHFQVEEKTEDRIRMIFRADSRKPYGDFPHAFSFRITVETGPGGVRQETQITNHSDTCMPLMLGWHTSFQLPSDGKTLLKLSVKKELLRDPVRLLPTGSVRTESEEMEQLRQGSFRPGCRKEPLSMHFEGGPDMRMVLEDPAGERRIVYEAEGYCFWMLYGGGPMDFLCVEPQTCMINAPNTSFPRHESGFRSLAPGETAVFGMRIYVEH